MLHVARDLLRRRALLFHRSRDRSGYFGEADDRQTDFLDLICRFYGCYLDTAYLLPDFPSRFCGLFGQCLHFGGDHGKSPSSIPGAGSFDCRIERQEIWLARDTVDQIDDIANTVGRR